MKIILHIGQHKTGTTTLQNSYFAVRKRLPEFGIHYPEGARPVTCHHFLADLICERGKTHPPAMRWFNHDLDLIDKKSFEVLDRVALECREGNPKLLILSSEHIWSSALNKPQRSIAELVRRLSDDILPVIYVRDPADRYMSGAQQCLRDRAELNIPRPLALRAIIEGLEVEFGTKVQVAAYHRDLLKDGDIVADFTARFVEPIVGPVPILRSISQNESLSAEAMAFLQEFQQANQDTPPGEKSRQMQAYIELIQKLERRLKCGTKPQLHPELRAAILRGSDDLHWLQDTYGITFPDVDYALIDGHMTDAFDRVAKVADICALDERWLGELRTYCPRHLARTDRPMARLRRNVRRQLRRLRVAFL